MLTAAWPRWSNSTKIKEAPVGAQKAFYKAALDWTEVPWDRRPRNKKFVKATMRLSADMTRLVALATSICTGDPVAERVAAREAGNG